VILTEAEEKMLEGKSGQAVRMAMRILTKLGDLYGAKKMIEITQAHIDGCCYPTVREAGLEFAEKLASLGARVKVPATLNITARDIERWKEFRIPSSFAEKSLRLERAYLKMGAIPTWTCAPYQWGLVPRFGQQIAWAESNAIAFVNSVIGARTERYGDFSDACAAITGRAPEFGLHLSRNRRGKVYIRLRKIKSALSMDDSFYPVFGYFLGLAVKDRIPVIEGIPREVSIDQLKSLGAAAATSGSVALFHILGVTPEARTYEEAFQGGKPEKIVDITFDELSKVRENLSTAKGDRVDLVAIGCPHYSFAEFQKVIHLLGGRRIHKGLEFWIFTNRTVFSWLKGTNLINLLGASGIRVSTDSCIIHLPLKEWGFKVMMTNSAKFAHYVPSTLGLEVVLGSTEGCVKSALSGKVVREETLWKRC